MSKRRKQSRLSGGSQAPAQPGKTGVVDPKKRVKVSKDEVGRLQQYNTSIKMIEARLGTIRAAYLDDEEKGIRYRKMEIGKRSVFLDEMQKKYKIVGKIVAADDETSELILE